MFYNEKNVFKETVGYAVGIVNDGRNVRRCTGERGNTKYLKREIKTLKYKENALTEVNMLEK